MAQRVQLLDLWVDCIDRATLMQRIELSCAKRKAMHIATTNVNFVTLARSNARFRAAVNNATVSVADGRLLLWMTRLAGCAAPEQITGHDLFDDCVRLAHRAGYRVFLLGGQPGVAQQLTRILKDRFSGLRVEGCDGGHFDAHGRGADADLAPRMYAFRPHMVLVALGAPKQELWIADQLPSLHGCVAIGVGGVFDTQVGRLPRAPRWLQVCGLESVFQLIVAPKRYARRYLLDDPPTFALMAWHALRQRMTPAAID